MATREELNAIYQRNFGRDIGDAGYDYWSQQNMGPAGLESAILGGADAADRERALNINYNQLFGRDVGAAGVNYWGSDDKWQEAVQGGAHAFDETLTRGAQGSDIAAANSADARNQQALFDQQRNEWQDQLNGFFDRQNEQYNNMFGQFNDAMGQQTQAMNSAFSNFGNTFGNYLQQSGSNNQNADQGGFGTNGGSNGSLGTAQQQQAASSWNTDSNWSPVYNPGQGNGATNGLFNNGWGQSNPFKVRTF